MLVFLDFSSATGIRVGCCDNANTDDYDGGGDDITIFFFSMILAEHFVAYFVILHLTSLSVTHPFLSLFFLPSLLALLLFLVFIFPGVFGTTNKNKSSQGLADYLQ